MKIDRRSNDTFSKFLAPAKINLFLKVKNKRPDGYHNLQSVFQFISLYDEILIRVRNDSQINIKNSSPFVSNKNDIAYKACKLILTGRDIGVDIEIKKNIPIGSGLGGGSSDAATVLMALNQLCRLGLSKKKLMELGLKLGADVPFFIFGENAWAESIGEVLYPIAIPEFDYIVAVPNISISTSLIFASFELTNYTNPLKIASSFNSIEHEFIDNDLESLVIKKFPAMIKLMNWMNGFGYAK
ncbi:MAG: 4-(cytidine 5'-diphospho)-2-C-methyl-D-erythritol kinase, partial [Methylophilales bacterium]|nr:4-(cytidine 5'-diphospho)-2-C-methyl-D-erythritol kinase [Methylophilales bacterium]